MAKQRSFVNVIFVASCIVSVSGIRKNVDVKSNKSPAAVFNEKTQGYCKAVLRRSTCSAEDYRGVLVAFHGFTACTDQYDELYPKWNDICWDVFAPVLPGHALGGHIINCEKGRKNKCSVSFNGGWQGFDLSELPTGYALEYSKFAKAVTKVAEKELLYRTTELPGFQQKARLATVGLSLGSAMAFRAVIDKPEAWSRALLIHPMMGLGQENSDFLLRNCLEVAAQNTSANATDDCGVVLRDFYIKSMGLSGIVARIVKRQLRGTTANEVQANMMKFYNTLSKHAPRILVAAILDAPVVWGGACNKITKDGRNGFCAFQQKHIMAVHVFGMDSLAYKFKPGRYPVTQILLTETDGITRNGLAYSAAKHMHCAAPDQEISVCIRLFKNGTENADPSQAEYWDKNNCLPHASLGSKENLDLEVRWWEPKLTSDIVSFFNTTDNVGHKGPFARDPDLCVDMPLDDGGEKVPWVRRTVLPRSDPSWSSCEEAKEKVKK